VDEASFLSVRDLLSLVEATRRLRGAVDPFGRRPSAFGRRSRRRAPTAGDSERPALGRAQEHPGQTDREYRAAIGELAEGKGQAAFRRLDRLGAVEQCADETRYGPSLPTTSPP